MKTKTEQKIFNKKYIVKVSLATIVFLGLTCALFSAMKNSIPFRPNLSYLSGEEINISVNTIKLTNNESSIIVGVLFLMTFISIKVRKAIDHI
jgi:hypothetical protein